MNSESVQNFKYPLPYVSKISKGAIISKFPKLKRRAFRIPELNALPRQYRFMMTKGGGTELTSSLEKEAVMFKCLNFWKDAPFTVAGTGWQTESNSLISIYFWNQRIMG
jgi:hypothetical protein